MLVEISAEQKLPLTTLRGEAGNARCGGLVAPGATNATTTPLQSDNDAFFSCVQTKQAAQPAFTRVRR